MRRSIFMRFLILAACLCCAPLAVQAQGDINQDGANDPIAIYKQAGINEAQEKKILALANAYEQTAQTKARAMFMCIQQLRTLSLNPDLNEQLVLSTQQSINKLQNEMAMDKMHLLIGIRRLLNQQQRQSLVGLLRKQRSEPTQEAPQN